MDFNFKLDSSDEKEVTLEKYKGKKLVLYYYPKNNTSGCTMESEGFRDLYDEFKKLNTEVVGMSRDGVKSHNNFKEKYNLPFEIISDKNRDFAEKNNLLEPGKMYGKDVIKTIRTTFMFDENGEMIKEFRDVDPKTHPQEVLDYIKSL